MDNTSETLLNDELQCWLLDETDPGARYLALRDVYRVSQNDPELQAARRFACLHGPIAAILEAMHPEGYWIKPGPGYAPKYRGSVWALITLAQLGAHVSDDERIRSACDYILEHNLQPAGMFTCTGKPSGVVDCLQGNLCAALLDLGVPPERLERAFDWLARSQTGEGMAPPDEKGASFRYYQYKSGPDFACAINAGKACGWGATKAALALSKLPPQYRTPAVDRAMRMSVDFLFSVDPSTAAYPLARAPKPSRDWWKFGFPVFYITDILQVVEALVGLGCGQDPRLQNALRLVEAKRDAQGRWALEFDYPDKTWGSFGVKRAPNRWVTIRALRTLRAARGLQSPAAQPPLWGL